MAKKPARRSAYHSSTAQKKAVMDADLVIDPPSNVTPLEPEERTLWDQIISARPPDMWREFELVLVHKIVKLETRIRILWAAIDASGEYTIETKYGIKENPQLTAADKLQKQQLSYIRTLSLGVRPADALATNNHGKKAKPRRKEDNGSVLSMIVGGNA